MGRVGTPIQRPSGDLVDTPQVAKGPDIQIFSSLFIFFIAALSFFSGRETGQTSCT